MTSKLLTSKKRTGMLLLCLVIQLPSCPSLNLQLDTYFVLLLVTDQLSFGLWRMEKKYTRLNNNHEKSNDFRNSNYFGQNVLVSEWKVTRYPRKRITVCSQVIIIIFFGRQTVSPTTVLFRPSAVLIKIPVSCRCQEKELF